MEEESFSRLSTRDEEAEEVAVASTMWVLDSKSEK
jgi:hypothetical protein